LIIFALLLFLKERLLFSSLFLKERKSDLSFCCSFWKSNCSFCRSLEKRKKSDRSFALLQRAAAGLSICSFWKWAIAHFCSFWKSKCYFRRSFWKSKRAIALFVALFEKRLHFWLLFWKEQKKSDRSFAKSTAKSVRSFGLFKRANEWAIALSLFWKEWKWAMIEWAIAQPCSCRVGHLFILKMSDCSFLLFLKEWKSDRYFHCSFWKSKKTIAFFVALFERVIALLVALLKRAKKEQLLICSFAKSTEKSGCSFALFKRANEQAIALSLFWKE